MKTTAIICEYNPLTNGHLRHLQQAREQTQCDTVICIMSGSFTQRGDAAIVDKYQRAETAVRLGADMVVELPLIYAISPADNFAYGALKVISNLPEVDCLSFGSECGDVELLKRASDFLMNEPEEYKTALARYQDEGNSFPKARSMALSEYAKAHTEYLEIADVLDKPNNILGIAYIQAAKKLGLNINFHTVSRQSDYNNDDIACEYPSASAVRRAILNQNWSDIKKAVPMFTYNLLESYKNNGTSLGDLCLYKLKDINGYTLAGYYDYNGGLNNRIKLAAESAVSYEQFLENAKTKKFTLARIKRLSLYALFDITQNMYDEALSLPPYVFVLAINKARKAELLNALHVSCANTLIRYSDIDKVDKRLRYLIKLDFKAQGILAMINRSDYYNKTMLII